MATLAVVPALAKDYKSITIATEGAYAPWNFKDASGNLVGVELDLVRDLCKRMGIQCKIVEQAWDGIIPSLQAGKYDAIMAGMSITKKRQKVITFSRNYAATPTRFVVLKSSKSSGFKTMLDAIDLTEVSASEKTDVGKVVAEFKGKTIGVWFFGNEYPFLSWMSQEGISTDGGESWEKLQRELGEIRMMAWQKTPAG